MTNPESPKWFKIEAQSTFSSTYESQEFVEFSTEHSKSDVLDTFYIGKKELG